MSVSAFLIVLNEEEKIGRTLDSLNWVDELIVVDGGSSDRTIQICKQGEAKVFERPFDNFQNQKNYALSLTNHEWVFSIDSDEVVSEDLKNEILSVISSPGSLDAYWVKRKNYFLGKPLRFGRQSKDRVLRLFRKKVGHFRGLVHEEVKISGKAGLLKNTLDHFGTRTLKEYYSKLKLYTDLEARRMIAEKRVPSYPKAVFYPIASWGFDYLIFGSFLDGWHGFLYHALSCYYGWLKNFKCLQQSKRQNK